MSSFIYDILLHFERNIYKSNIFLFVSGTADQPKGFIAMTFPIHLGIHSGNESHQGRLLGILLCVLHFVLNILHSPKFIYRQLVIPSRNY